MKHSPKGADCQFGHVHSSVFEFEEDLKAGEVITPYSIRSVRPGFGLAPKYWDEVVGKRVKAGVEKNSPVRRANTI